MNEVLGWDPVLDPPTRWRSLPLGSVGTLRGGNGFPVRFQGRATGDYPFLKVSDMNRRGNERRMAVAGHWVSESARRVIGAGIHAADSVVFAKVGAAVFQERKRLLAAPSCLDNNMISIRPDPTVVDPMFLLYALEARRLGDLVSTTALPALNAGSLATVHILVPEVLGEQRVIADVLMDVDAEIEALADLVAKKRWMWTGLRQRLLGPDGQATGHWVRRSLGDLGSCIRGVTYVPERDLTAPNAPGSVRLLRANNISDGTMNTGEVHHVIARRVAAAQVLRRDDLVICSANGSRNLVGKAAPFVGGGPFSYTFGAFMSCYRPDSTKIHPQFAAQLLQTHQFREQVDVALAGSSINNLGPTQIAAFEFDVPTERSAQVEIAGILEDAEADLRIHVSCLEKKRQTRRATLEALISGRTRLT